MKKVVQGPLTEQQWGLVLSHGWLIRKVLCLHARGLWGLARDDLQAAAEDGLIRAAQKFDPGLGHKFQTYAWYWVRCKVLRARREFARRKLQGEQKDCEPQSCEDDAEHRLMVAEALHECRRWLDPRSWQVLVLLYRDGCTLEEAGRRLGNIGRERVRQLQDRALERLRERLILKARDFAEIVS